MFFIDQEDILMLFLLFFVWISMLLGYKEQRSINHTLSYFYTISFNLILFKFYAREFKISLDQILKTVLYSLIVCDLIVVAEWTLLNWFNVVIREWFITGGDKTSNMSYYNQRFFYSVAGVTEEPGHTAYFTNVMFPLALYYVQRAHSKVHFYLLICLQLLSLVLLASAAGIVFLSITFVLLNFKKVAFFKRIVVYALAVLVLLLGISLFSNTTKNFLFSYYRYVEEKITLAESNPSAVDRSTKIKLSIDRWLESPLFGQGPGYGVEEYKTGYFNTYLTVLSDTGIIPFILICLFLVIVLLKANKLNNPLKYYLLFSLIYLLMHSSICVLYYHFPYFLPIVVAQLAYYQMKTEQQLVESEAYNY